MGAEQECIQLSFPVNAAYVSAARLTASSIANRMGFDIDEIEDIKAAVSEACTFIIKKLRAETDSTFQIQFYLKHELLTINMTSHGSINPESSDEEMGIVMIRALMDETKIEYPTDQNISIMMEKSHKMNLFS